MAKELSTRAQQISPASVPIPPLIGPSFRVFHVNDSTDDQVLFQAACRRGGVPFDWHVVDSAEKGISYLKTLIEHSARLPVCWPDLILLDIVMPVVSGFEVLKYVRATPELRHLPVIVFTGHMYPNNRAESLRLGANAFRMKPHDFEEIVLVARELYELLKELKGTV
jgi:CheY-like chemotaxis protein